MKTYTNKNKTKCIWFDTHLKLWTLQQLDADGNQYSNVDYSSKRKKAFDWLKI